MDPRILFNLKERLILEVIEKSTQLSFANEDEKLLYINTSIEAYLAFYSHAMIEMIDDEAA